MNIGKRYALLLCSSLPIDTANKPLNKKILKRQAERMQGRLADLGSHSFRWSNKNKPLLFFNKRYHIIDQVLDALVPQPESDDLFLLYYLGHGFVGAGRKLLLAFKGVDLSAQNTTNYELDVAVDKIFRRGFNKVLVILDCCHSEIAHQKLALNADHDKYFLMTSTTGWQYLQPGARFTEDLCEALIYKNRKICRDRVKNAVTFMSWFKRVKEMIGPSQKIAVSGGLGEEILVPLDIEISPPLNRNAPKKSYYFKLYELLRLLVNKPMTIRQISQRIQTKNLASFILLSYSKGRLVETFISTPTLTRYMHIANKLGLVQLNGNRWGITRRGNAAVASSGAQYNLYLTKGILNWLPSEYTLEHINELLLKVIEKGILPNVSNLLLTINESDRIPAVPSKQLRIALRLLSYAEVLKRATPDTFFPV